MNREDYIKALIKSHGYTMKDFAKIINMPYTTLLSILNGSIGGAAMDNVLKICGALNIRIEDLNNLAANGEAEATESPTTAVIDPQLLKLLQNLPTEKQIALKLLLADKQS
jgi:transcriptional regulator with XRE-family HTH domain